MGLVAIAGGPIQISTFPVQQLYLTDRGRTFLQRGDLSPHDPLRFSNAIARLTAPDEVAITYFREAVDSFATGSFRSCAVMLGCACERLMLILS